MPQLRFQRDGQTVFVHALNRNGRTVIGRSDRCDLSLPSDLISRTHCMIEARGDQWWLVDRSRHGTRVNGAAISRVALSAGDTIQLGDYTAEFGEQNDEIHRITTATVPLVPAIYEDLVALDADRPVRQLATLTIETGPRAGLQVTIDRARVSVGGPGSGVVLDDHLPLHAFALRVVRGRVMVEPGVTPPFLDGHRVRELTPLLDGERLRIGEHTLSVGVSTLDAAPSEMPDFGEMVGRTKVMKQLFGILHRMAAHDACVLLTGESGTGKEVAARGLHTCSARADKAFVAVNCAAVADNLFESELFGHEKGSFTGATSRQEGSFQRADGGTLFLDEIGEMKLELQAKLLRALESGEVRRVGGAKPEYPNVRVVAATNRNLVEMVRAGTFREDLYFRLAVLTVRMPPLRERLDDVPALARALLARHHPGSRLSSSVDSALKQYN